MKKYFVIFDIVDFVFNINFFRPKCILNPCPTVFFGKADREDMRRNERDTDIPRYGNPPPPERPDGCLGCVTSIVGIIAMVSYLLYQLS